jgi:hypothetical protein
MSATVSAAEAGRIRDAARFSAFGGFVAIVCFFVSFVLEPAILGFAVWPVAFGVLAVAVIPLLRPIGMAPAVLVTIVGIAGAVLEVVGVLAPVGGGPLRISSIFGAGTVCIGAWLVGVGAISRVTGSLASPIPDKTLRGGIGFGIIGLSWFIDVTISLFVLLAGAILSGGVGPFFKEIRRIGLPPETPPAAAATEPAEP